MRKIERHPSNQGSVVIFDMYGQEVKLFVADAKYRTCKKWCERSTNVSSLSKFTDDIKIINPNNSFGNPHKTLPYTITDEQLQSRFQSFKTDKSAKENTDVLMQYKDTDAAHWCRSIELEGAGALDLPNIYELMIIYLESDRIDALDPTVNEYKQYALGKLNPNGRFEFKYADFCWSSTYYYNYEARGIDCFGWVQHENKNNINGVIPVKELYIDFI